MSSPWAWEEANHRYRNTETGRFLGARGMLQLRDRFTDAMHGRVAELAGQIARGDLSATDWERAMRAEIRTLFIDQYVMGHGGRGTMTQADWGRIGQMCRAQYQYLNGFTKDIEGGRYTDDGGIMSEAAIAARAALYMEAGTFAYERAHALSYGIPKLPAYPGDGSTICKTACRCNWSIEEAQGGWDATWVLDSAAEHCETCLSRSQEWAPYHVEKE